MNKKILGCALILGSSAAFSPVSASNAIAGGIWINYAKFMHDGNTQRGGGDIGDEAFILYADGSAEEGQGNWSYSAELRIGPGSFTDTANNSTGDQVVLHKAWVGWDINDNTIVRVGKSQVPFGWKTSNFWPGDMFQAGYGDQMDVGVKFSGSMDALNYDVAYYLQDDFGSTSTDTVDDNRHWGSSTTYRKVQTFVGNLGYTFAYAHTLGVSLQAGQLQDFTTADNDVDGDHDAFVLYYKGAYSNDMYLNAEFISANRDLPTSYAASAGLNTDTETTRWAFEVGHSVGDWTYYLDVTGADTDTTGNASDSITAFAPGVKYDYGPGWIYAEYLDQNGYIDRNGDVVDNSDFEALYLTIDWYF